MENKNQTLTRTRLLEKLWDADGKVCIRQYPNRHHAPPARKAWVSRLYPDSQGYWLPYEGIAMKKQTIFFACIISIVCGMMLRTLGAALLAQDMFKSQAQLVSVLQTTDSIYEALHTAPRMTDTRLGEALLGRGGYTRNFIFGKMQFGFLYRRRDYF